MAAISNDWLAPLKPEFAKPYYATLYKKVKEEYSTRQIFPPADDIFNAFALTPLSQVKVVILGQDPYHGDGQAEGLCFSVKPGIDIPPSLMNIYKELHDDCGCYIPNNGSLVKWAKEGVLLLNTVLTVRAHPGQFPSGHRLGGVHRRGDPDSQRTGSAYRVPALGKTRPDEKSHAEQSEAPHSGSASPESAFRLPWLLRLRPFQPDEPFPESQRPGSDRLAN